MNLITTLYHHSSKRKFTVSEMGIKKRVVEHIIGDFHIDVVKCKNFITLFYYFLKKIKELEVKGLDASSSSVTSPTTIRRCLL